MAIYLDDRELVEAHRSGDQEAFAELVREYRSSLYAHARRKLFCDASAEDAVQETLVRAYRALPQFSGDYRLGPWLHRIMANVCVDEAKRRRRDGDKTDLLSAQPSARVHSPAADEELGLHIDDSSLRSALGEIDDPYREALVLRFVDGLDYEDVAVVSGISEDNARARVSRARSAMRSIMKGLAAFPVLLVGLLKRGEKAAAAASSASTPVAAAASSGVVGAATQTSSVVSTSLPMLTEATVAVTHAAPAAMPVIAKAAVGIGLAAAVLTPTSDSSMHRAVESIAEGTAGVVVADTKLLDPGDPVVEVAADSIDSATTGLAEVAELSASAPPELSPSSAVLADSVQEPSFERGTAAGDAISWQEAGAGRFYPVGNFAFVFGDEELAGELVEASFVRLGPRDEIDGKARFDGLFEVDLLDGSTASLNVLGFAAGVDQEMQIDGFFRLELSDVLSSEAGSFTGVMTLSSVSGAASLILTP